MEQPLDLPPFLPGFDPSQAWPPEALSSLLGAGGSENGVALWGAPGADFASAVWTLTRADRKNGSPTRRVDLSRLSPSARLKRWTAMDPLEGKVWFVHAELIPSHRRPMGAMADHIASFATASPTPPEPLGAWRWVFVPPIAAYRQLEECLQAAWRHLSGENLPKSLAGALAAHTAHLDAESLERWLVEAAPKGREALASRLEASLSMGKEASSWRRRKRLAERALLEEALERCGGNRTRAARALGVHRNTVLWHLRKKK